MLLFNALFFVSVTLVLSQAAKSELDLEGTSGDLQNSYNYEYYEDPQSMPNPKKPVQTDVDVEVLTKTTTKKPSKKPDYDYPDEYDYNDEINNESDDNKVNGPEIGTHEFINQPTSKPTEPIVTPAPISADAETTRRTARDKLLTIISKPGILAGIVGGAIIGVLTAILLIMFIVYRMKKKDEGSYALEETKKPLNAYDYRNCPTKEFYA